MSARIASIACVAPEYSITQDDAARMAQGLCAGSDAQKRTLGRIYSGSRIRRRGSVLLEANGRAQAAHPFYPPPRSDGDRGPTTGARMAQYAAHAVPMAVDAARAAMQACAVAPGEIAHVVTASCTGFAAPGVDIALVRELGLARDASRTHVGFMGCHAAVNALRVASSLACGAQRGAALLVCVEACSLHFQYGWRPDRVVANALFADGGAGAVVLPEDHPAPSGRFRVIDTRSCLLADDPALMGWAIGDHGFEMTLSSRVPGALRETLAPWLAGWLGGHGLGVRDVGAWAVHPGGPKILDAVAGALALDATSMEASRGVLSEHGNMSSATLLFILDRLRPAAGTPVVAMAFGPGLSCEAALLRGG